MKRDQHLTRYWLEHEYASGLKPYLISGNSYAKKYRADDEAMSSKREVVCRHGITQSQWLYRDANIPAAYVYDLIRRKSRCKCGDMNQDKCLSNGDGLKLVAAHIACLQEDPHSECFQFLLKLCMGAQYFSIVTSDYFPHRDQPAVKVCRFYAHVVLGEQNKATMLYADIGRLVESRCLDPRDASGLILANIRSLFLLRSGEPVNKILEINKLLVAYSKTMRDEPLTAILLLNQARLNRVLGMTNRAISNLEESYLIAKSIPGFKIRLYYLMQLALVKEQQNSLLDVIDSLRGRAKDGDVFEGFGWRIAKLLKPAIKADMMMGIWPQLLSDALMDSVDLSVLLAQLVRGRV